MNSKALSAWQNNRITKSIGNLMELLTGTNKTADLLDNLLSQLNVI